MRLQEATRASADRDLMIPAQTNWQPLEGTDKIGDAVNALYEIVKRPKAD